MLLQAASVYRNHVEIIEAVSWNFDWKYSHDLPGTGLKFTIDKEV